jgi:hypothetical protein
MAQLPKGGTERSGLMRLFREVTAVTRNPVPRARMIRTGATLGVTFGVWWISGRLEEAVLAAVFTNLLVFLDHAGPLRERLGVVAAAALIQMAAGALGVLVSGSEPMILVATLGLALVAGLVHGSVPGVEMIPRNALITFIASAYLPVVAVKAGAPAVLVGALIALAGIIFDFLLRRGVRGPDLAALREAAIWPSLRFCLIYGATAILGLLLGKAIGTDRPYWITITILVVMQPDRAAGLRRSIQRLLGTLLGVALGFLIAAAAPEAYRLAVFLVFIFALPFVWPLGFARNYGIGVAILSAWILTLLDFALPRSLASELFLARLFDTAIGCALALAATVLLVTRPVATALARVGSRPWPPR